MERKQQGLAIKLDMANAFDKVNHFFLFEIMPIFVFSKRFVRWVKACISNSWIAPLVNGRPTKFFQATKGLRQGFPMSPFLYLLVVESTSRKLQQLQESGDLKGLNIARGVNVVNRAQFVDDTIMLGGVSSISAEIFKCALSTFLKASDNKVNSTKSKVYIWNCSPGTLAKIARTLGFEGKLTWNSFNYLGIPIFKGKKMVVN